MKKRGYTTTSSQRCEICNDMLFRRQFYLFPCSHGFHGDCLMKKMTTFLDPNQLASIRNIEEQLKLLAVRVKDSDKRAITQQEYLQNELDGFIAADCPLCGYVMIQALTVPIITDDDRSEALSWEI